MKEKKLAEMIDLVDSSQQDHLDLAVKSDDELTIDDMVRKITVRSFIRDVLNDKYIASEKLARQSIAALATKPVRGAFFFGGAGCGKTQLAKSIATHIVKASTIVFYQCFAGVRDEDFFVKLLPSEDTKSGIRSHEGPIIQALRASLKERTALIIDEWDKSKPSSDAILLNLLQECRAVYNDVDIVGDPRNLVVFITMNDERYLSEPGLRRYSKVDFEIMHPSLVYSALQLYHPGHPYIDAAVNLYCRWYAAGIDKPCTVQELVQLLDAINVLGKNGVWDELVRQFVTKDAANHTKLCQIESRGDVVWKEVGKNVPVSSENCYMTGTSPVKDTRVKLPTAAKLKHITGKIVHDFPHHKSPEKPDVYVYVDKTVESYDKLARAAKAPGADPALIESAIVTEDGAIKMTRPWELSKWKSFPLWGEEGEATFSVVHNGLVTWETFKEMCDNVSAKVTRFDKYVITARVFDTRNQGEILADMKWTQKGLELISGLLNNEVVNKISRMVSALEAEKKRKEELKNREKARKDANDELPLQSSDNLWTFDIGGTEIIFLYEKGFLYMYVSSDPDSHSTNISQDLWVDEGGGTPERFGMFYLGNNFGDLVSKDGKSYRRDAKKIPSNEVSSTILYWIKKVESFVGLKAKERKVRE